MAQNIARCGYCGEVNFCGWYRKDAPKDRYGRIDRDYMDSNPVAYCSEEHRDAADLVETFEAKADEIAKANGWTIAHTQTVMLRHLRDTSPAEAATIAAALRPDLDS